jgi:hypothetical protein
VTTISATEARKQLYKLLDEIADFEERGSTYTFARNNWTALNETNIPGGRSLIAFEEETETSPGAEPWAGASPIALPSMSVSPPTSCR